MLLKPAHNTSAYLKIGLLGFEGSGKTRTACDFAIGICKKIKSNKAAFFDTETGSDYHIKRFKEQGIELFAIKSRAFVDLIATIKEAQDGKFGFLVIDSITHVWRELVESWLKKKGRNYLTMQDWGVLKTEWGQYTDLYINSKLHIAMCGRAGYEYDMSESEDGRMEVTKSGTKMKVETETGFEPSLLLEMEKVRMSKAKKDKNAKGLINRCIVLKDRSDTMNGKIIDFPKFEDFKTVVDFLNLGGEHIGVDTTRTSAEIFGNQDRSWSEMQKQKEITQELIKEALILNNLDGSSAEAKKERTELLNLAFGTSSPTAIGDMKLGEMQSGLKILKNIFVDRNSTATPTEAKPAKELAGKKS